MKCFDCGAANPVEAEKCSFCGKALLDGTSSGKAQKVSIPHLIVFGLIAMVLLILCTLSIIASYVTVALIILYSLKHVGQIRKEKHTRRKKYLGITLIALIDLSLVCGILWRLDAPPIPDDYSIVDLRSAPDEYSDSFEILSSLADDAGSIIKGSGIGLTDNDIDNLEEIFAIVLNEFGPMRPLDAEQIAYYSDTLQEIWDKAQKGITVIDTLCAYDEISDHSVPEWGYVIPFLHNLRRMGELYALQTIFQCEQGNGHSAVNELIKFDAVVRKLSINARGIITKLVCYSLFRRNIITANYVTNNPQTSQETVELIAQHFVPYSHEQVSLRTPFIFEYLYVTKGLKNMFVEDLPFMRFLRNVPFLKWNSTVRVTRNHFDDLLEQMGEREETQYDRLSVWPMIYPDLGPVSMDENGEFPWFYEKYNPIGCKILVISLPVLTHVITMQTDIEVQNDLFQVVLNKRLNRPANLQARAYSEEYIIDLEKNIIFSPGPDRMNYTEDDIMLSINPTLILWN